MAVFALAKLPIDSTAPPPSRDSGVSIGTETTIGEHATTGTDIAVDLSDAEGPRLPGVQGGVPLSGYGGYGSGYGGYGSGYTYHDGRYPGYPMRPSYGGGEADDYYSQAPLSQPFSYRNNTYQPGSTAAPYGSAYQQYSGQPPSLYGGYRSSFAPTNSPFSQQRNPSFTTSVAYAPPSHANFTSGLTDLTATMQSASLNLNQANPRTGEMAGVKTDLSRILTSGLVDQVTRTNDPHAVRELTSRLDNIIRTTDSVYTREMGMYEGNQYTEIRALERGFNELKKAHRTMTETQARWAV